MAIYLTKESKVLVQGMTGGEGMKHTRRMLAAGTNVVGGVNPRKAGRTVYYRLAGSFPEPLLEHCLRELIHLSQLAASG